MSLAPRIVLVHRRTELTELLARHGTRGQVEFFLKSRNRTLDEVVDRDQQARKALGEVGAAIPLDWRRGVVEREDLSRFLFAPEDVVIGFVAGTPVSVNGNELGPVDLIATLNAIGGRHGVGRNVGRAAQADGDQP